MEQANRMPQQHRDEQSAHERFVFIGGHLALDFANTLGGLRGGNTRELLPAYADLVTWGLQAGALAPDEACVLLDIAQLDSIGAVAVLERAHRLREAIYTLALAHLQGDTARSQDLAILNSELSLAFAHRRVTSSATVVEWAWDWREEHPGGHDGFTNLLLDTILCPVVLEAADLLTVHNHPPLRQCASDECSWLYLDATRNHSRRWCDMKGCGNKAKVRRYRQRQAPSSP